MYPCNGGIISGDWYDISNLWSYISHYCIGQSGVLSWCGRVRKRLTLLRSAKLLFKYCQYDTNAGFYTPPSVFWDIRAVKGFHLAVHLSFNKPLLLFQTNKEVRSPRVAAIDLPVVSDGVRNIKSMWEKGNVFSSTVSTPSSNKVSNIHSQNTDGQEAHLSCLPVHPGTLTFDSLGVFSSVHRMQLE